MENPHLIYHNSHWGYYRSPFGAVPAWSEVTLRVAVHASLRPRESTLRVWHADREKLFAMRHATSIPSLDHISANYRMAGSDSFRRFRNFGMEGSSRTGEYAHGGLLGGSASSQWGAPGGIAHPSAVGAFGGMPPTPVGDYGDTPPPPDGWYHVFEATYAAAHEPALVWYYFAIGCDDGTCRYYGDNNGQFGGEGQESMDPPPSYQITVYDPGFETPQWFRHSVMYQIFPDRFFQSRKEPLTQAELEKKRPDYIYHEDWRDKPIYKPDPRTGEIMNNDFFGGNLAGIVDKLPYLKDLGVSVVYLNPIFESYSNHRYDTGDYHKVDATLGTRADFRHLCARARAMGMRVVLDGVFNHTGSDSAYFNRYGLYDCVGAYQSKASKYHKWYSFRSFPDDYECWWGILTLPSLNESEPSFQRYIIDSENSITRRWLRCGASGWRLDVVDELPDDFLKALRVAVKSVDEDAIIIGEVWEDASNKVSYGVRKEYLLGYELDSVMNYVFKNALLDFLLMRAPSGRFIAEMRRLADHYPTQCFYSLMNLIGGHDVPRALTLMSDPHPDLTRDQKAMHKPTTRQRKIGVRRLKLASLVQMAMPGVPSVYYGDEAGMAGFEDPFNRETFPWDEIDEDLHSWYKRVITLRNAFATLRTGTFELVKDGDRAEAERIVDPCASPDDSFAIIRAIRGRKDVFGEHADSGFAIVGINRDPERPAALAVDLSNYNLPALFDPFSNGAPNALKHGRVILRMPPLGCRVLTYPAVEIN